MLRLYIYLIFNVVLLKQISSMSTKKQAQRLWREADAVCFDVDSTVCVDEAIDELAEFCGVGPQVAACTVKAMGGGMTFREALIQRLDIMQPSHKIVEDFIALRPPRLSSGIRDLMNVLKAKNIMVFLVSGGFRNIIAPVANELGIAQENIYANTLLFNEDGSYAGFDTNEPTSETGGKPRVIQLIRNKYSFKTLVFVGDGVTDMETYPPADAFIGYGGNVVRSKVKDEAAWYVTDFRQLIEEFSDDDIYISN
uniref:Phosphoserine phosphatase n=1 Tax=Arion vulgaris TaxID=1028688 RepID=A0A0B7B6V5_9EUPU